MKKLLEKVLDVELGPIRARRSDYEKGIPGVYEMLHDGSKVAEAVAAQTLSDVKQAMKIDYFDDAELIAEQTERYGS